jgi:major membrane immunogen (membrane-anchored lipoprotein)
MHKALLWGVTAMAAVLLTACGEPDQSTNLYAEGQYSGKADQQPWQVAPYDGNKAKWENAVRVRTQGQNEYTR